jgi:hypothetical protein
VEFTVTGEGGGTPTGQVTVFSLQEEGGCTVPVSQGSCDITLSVGGTHRLGATYVGDSQFEESVAEVDHVVLPAPPTNQAPTAADDAYSTPPGAQPLSVSAPGVLQNDSDDTGPLTAQNPSTPGKGTVQLSNDGSFTYTPFAGQVDNDSFTYEASDGSMKSTATVTITIVQ